MADVVRKIPDQLSSLGVFAQGSYRLQDVAFDYAIGGLPFLSATQDVRPYTEQMAAIRKQQFDNSQEPGEQSLYPEGWWLRSQSTFTGGAGILYQDPDTDNQYALRYADSLGVDPWTSGKLQLLRNTSAGLATASTPLLARGFVDPSGVDSYWQVYNDHMDKVNAGGTTAIIGATLDPISDITNSGATYFIAKSNGVWSGLDAAAATQIYTTALSDNAVIEFLKGRLILTNDNKVYQLVTAGGALPTETYAHQDPEWRWRSITDGPTAIYIAGDSGTTSEIHKFSPTLSATGVPELSWTGVTATMPAGEIIKTIYQYVGSFVGIATNKGFRVGEIDQGGDISYGPLLFQPTGGCDSIVGYDRFMFVGAAASHDGASGLYRVDLGQVIQEQTTRATRYAYARDIYLPGSVGRVSSLTMYGNSDRKVYTVEATGVAVEDASTKIASGYLSTGRIRFNTGEPKLYKFFSVRLPTLNGNVSISVLPEGGGEVPYITYTPALGSGTKDVAISDPTGPQNFIALKFTLFRGTDTTKGGEMNEWQLKALPGTIRQRIITHTFQLFDQEQDRTGQRLGYDGYARDRFELFKAIARTGDVYIYQELQEDLSAQVVIDDWQFKQSAPPGPNKGALGGYLTVIMRTVAEST